MAAFDLSPFPRVCDLGGECLLQMLVCVLILCGLRLHGAPPACAGRKWKSRFAQRGRPSFHVLKALRVPKVRTPAGPAASQTRGPTFSGCDPARVGGTENLSSRQAPRDTGGAGLWTTATGTLAPLCVRMAAFGTGGVLSPRPAAGKQFAEPLSRHVSWHLPCGGKILSESVGIRPVWGLWGGRCHS